MNRLDQKPAHARMMKRNLITSLLLYESVRTTKKRAQVVAPEIDKLITYAKKNVPHVAIRHINRFVTDTNASKKIMEVLIKRYAKKHSGLTSIKAAGFRLGDGAQLVDISLVEGEAMREIEKKQVKQGKQEKQGKKTSPVTPVSSVTPVSPKKK